jgi:transcriptional regulator with XRE-family HTH domain
MKFGDPSTPSFGEFVRLLRKKSGVTGAQLGERAGFSQSKVSKLERGHAHPTVHDATAIARALGVSRDVEHRLRVAATIDAGLEAGNTDILSIQRQFTGLHVDARRLRYTTTLYIPAPFQTRAYATSIFEREPVPNRKTDIRERIALRAELQAKLHDERKRFQFLMSTSSFELRHTNVDEHVEQLHVFRDWLTKPNIEIRVADAGPLSHTSGNFVIFDQSVLVLEELSWSRFLHDSDRIAIYIRHFEQSWKSALGGDAVADLVDAKIRSFAQDETIDLRNLPAYAVEG